LSNSPDLNRSFFLVDYNSHPLPSLATRPSFRIPVTPLEHYLMSYDSQEYPFTFWVCCWFTGLFDRQIFLESLKEIIPRHPLLGALVQGNKHRRTSSLFWVKKEDPLPYIDWNDEGKPFNFPQSSWIDLRKEGGIRIFIREKKDKTRVFFQFHHACCDGHASQIFIDDLLTIYSAKKTNSPTDGILGHLNESYLIKRNKFKLRGPMRLWELPSGLYKTAKFFFKKVRPLETPNSRPSFSNLHTPKPSYNLVRFSQEDTQKIKDSAKELGCSFNDLILRDLFLTVHQWNIKWDPSEKLKPIRIGIPVDLRRFVELSNEMPTANIFTISFMDRKPHQIRYPEKLLDSIRRDMAHLKTRESGTWLHRLLRISGIIGWNSFMLPSGERRQGTTMLSYIGEHMRFSSLKRDHGFICAGNMKLDLMSGLVPLTDSSPAVFFCSKYADRFAINMHYDPRKLPDEHAKELSNLYCQQIKQSIS